MNAQPAKVLLVEDSEADVELIKFALKKNKIFLDLDVVNNGNDALDYLFQRNGYENESPPNLILLDINLPGMNGIETLKQIKENEKTKRFPVVMLTSSKQDEDVLNSYSHHANCYIQKPVEFSQLQDVIFKLEKFWFSVVVLPQNIG